ncbi:MAG: serine/threonine protein phosphatase [Pirellulales bacterium]|nr:serine/threonine protein phosphatase [Pirellulales bacterium]
MRQNRTLAIGDIHGCLMALDTLLDVVNPGSTDVLISLGDYVDRGPESCGVLERILGLMSQTRLFPLLGNHEVMMVGAWRDGIEEDWLAYGGAETLESYGRANGLGTIEDVPEHHWDFLTSHCVWHHEGPKHIFVHAGLEANVPLGEQDPLWLFWEKLRPEVAQPHVSGKIVVCGHTPQRSGLPLNLGHTVCIDTFVYGEDGWLTCLDVDSGQYWQANQRGELREGELEPPDHWHTPEL